MWPFKTKQQQAPGGKPRQVQLSSSDCLHDRVEKAMRYAGMVNPNRLGLVDSVTFILGEYEKIDAQAAEATK